MKYLGWFTICLLVTLWLGSFSYLAIFLLESPSFPVFLLFASLSIWGAIYWWQQAKRNHQHIHKLRLINTALTSLAPGVEAILFGEKGKTLWTTHPNTYPNQDEFLKKLLLRTSPTPESSQLKELIETGKRGEVLLKGGANGLGQDQKWWLVLVVPLDLRTMYGKKSLFIVVRDVTTYLENYDQLKISYMALESFIDHAPFGIYYASRTGHFVDVNGTFCRWLGLKKEELLGRVVSDFLGQADKGRNIIHISSPNSVSFRAAILNPPAIGSHFRTQPTVLCRLDYLETNIKQDILHEQVYTEAPIPAVIISAEGEIISQNAAFSIIMGENLGNNFFNLVHASTRSEVMTKIRRIFESSTLLSPFEIRFEGDKIQTTAYGSKIRRPESDKPDVMLQFIDISEQKRLEQQFIQSQKMQAVGQLAGGIAHDFNNLLTAMIGFCDLLLQRYLPNDPSYTDVMQIKQNANRAANLVRQLLAFSRQQTLQPRVISITDNLVELSTLLRRLIGAGIELEMIHARDLWAVKADVSQLEQVIINLVVNARDAMPEGGKITIRTSNQSVAQQYRVGHDLIPKGDYAAIEVIDTGIGIPPEHLEHIFEPFFSTKEVGQGTGLGLSTVYGIVKQTGGFVLVESMVSKGTTFRILLPRYKGDEQANLASSPEQYTGDLTGGGTILLVEDEDAVRMFSARALREKGYRVIEAASGETALELIAKGEKFDLLVTDVVMPKMDGPTLSKKVRDIYPDAKTIFISGYTEDTFRKNLDHDAKIHFLPKPFTLKDLASKVKEVLTVKNDGMK